MFAIGLIVMSPTTVMASTANVQDQTSKLISVETGSNSNMTLQPPILSNIDKSAIIDAAMNVSGIKAWSNQWNYSTMDFRGEKTGTGVTWNTAVVTLRLSHTAKAPFSCDIGWFAIVDVDLATKKVLNAHHPTVESHGCHGIGSGPIIYKRNADPNPGYSTATQNDVNSSTSYYGNSAVIQPPSFNNPGIYNSMTEDVEQLVNVDWSKTCSLGSGSTLDCFLQGGWIITTPASGCSSCNILADSSDIVYVDQSTTGRTMT
ncbi:MAG: hypothetical protein KGI09_06110, partial [Thaumarchaeota archaeon]|nr:hypothetical protein [Nitrososphaerota archaeon]